MQFCNQFNLTNLYKIVDVDLYHEWKTDIDNASVESMDSNNLDEIVENLVTENDSNAIVDSSDTIERVTPPNKLE